MLKARSLIAVTLFALFVLAYAHTCALSVSWKNFSEDSGDLLASAYGLGIPHPTGYPLYVLLGRVFCLVMPGGIAFRVMLLSLVAAALAPALLFLTLARLLPGRNGLVGAAFGATALGFSLHFWSQAVVAEVYALHVLLLSLIVYFLVRWLYPDQTPSSPGESSVSPGHKTTGGKELPKFFFLSAYFLGVSFTNHMLSLLTLAFAAVLVFAARRRISLRDLALALVLFLLPLTLYACLPIRSMRNPELDWGNPETWNQLKWVVTGAQYRFRLMAAPFPQALAKLWPASFLGTGWLVLGFSAVGLVWGKLTRTLRAALIVMLVSDLAVVAVYEIPDPDAYFLPASFVLACLAGAGFYGVLEWLSSALHTRRRPGLANLGVPALGLALAAASIFPAAIQNSRKTDVSTDLHPYVFGTATFRAIEPNALIVSEYDGRTFALWFFRETEFRDSHHDSIVVLKYLLVWPWYVDNLRKLHPDLEVPEAGPMDAAMLALVASNLDRRPIYTVRNDPALTPFFDLKPILGGEAPLFRVQRRTGDGR